jgi:hypothetical protein
MMVLVHVTSAEWLEGCDDTDDHIHPEKFQAIVDLPGSLARADELVIQDAIHEALMTQCNCCVIDCEIGWEIMAAEEALAVNYHDLRAWGDDDQL